MRALCITPRPGESRDLPIRFRGAEEWIPAFAGTVDDVALLGQGGLLREVVGAVQLVEILGDDDALGVLPRAAADAVAGVRRRLAVGCLDAEIGVPAAAAGTGRLRQLLALPVSAGQAAEIGALAGPDPGHEKAHAGLLRRRLAAAEP